MRTPRRWIAGATLLAMLPATSMAMNLDQYLNEVVQKHRGLEALRTSIEASERNRVAGDMELVPRFTLQGTYLSDKKQPMMFGANESTAESYAAALSKRFSTGTDVSLQAKTVGMNTLGMDPAILTMLGQPSMYAQGGLGVTLSQSLWKNAFGRSTRLRRERELHVAAAESGSYDLQSRQILAGAESAFWDYLYLKEAVKVREASLERARRLETWIRRRQADGISDRADVLNVQTLVAARELQLKSAKDQFVAAEKSLRDYLELGPNDSLPQIDGQISQTRNLREMVGEGNVMRLDVYLASLQAKATAVGAREAEEATRADLTLSGSYFTNSYASGGRAMDGAREWTKTDTPTAQVSLTWTYLFDTDTKTAVRDAARAKATAAQMQAERAAREGKTAWEEMLRRHGELSQQIKSAETLYRLNTDLVKAQQDKYTRGRTITTEVINAEESAEEAELTLTKMRAEQRKLEAQSRMFIVVKE